MAKLTMRAAASLISTLASWVLSYTWCSIELVSPFMILGAPTLNSDTNSEVMRAGALILCSHSRRWWHLVPDGCYVLLVGARKRHIRRHVGFDPGERKRPEAEWVERAATALAVTQEEIPIAKEDMGPPNAGD